jgi:hypothetical protein
MFMKRYKYNIHTGVTRIKTNTRKYVIGTIASLTLVVGLAAPAFAAGNSVPGIDRYNNNPGRQQATEVGAQCDSGAGSGAFGYFGKDNNLAGGADGQQTGINNSSVCGNRQGNL